MRKRSALTDGSFTPRSDAESSLDRLAVLIDADNAHAGIVDALLAEIARFGVASVKRIYGDWTQPQLGSWKKVLLQQSIIPVQQFAYTKGKNATDSALIIDAMDLMYARRFDGFCLVSSDSDFTRLASRLREEGLLVYGFGERKTPEPFVSACDKFIYTEVLRPEAVPAAEPSRDAEVHSKPAETGPAIDSRQDPRAAIELIATAIDAVSDESGWAGLGAVGSTITKLRPDFDSRLYGHKKFSDLVRSVPERFELEERATGTGKSLFVRLARRAAK
ncbi:MAG: NYN domain-containing protein, partial [Gammaproteobacteria bacterium]